MTNNDRHEEATMRDSEHKRAEQRPSILLMASDRERLFALLGTAPATVNMETACFLREEIERADIVPDDIASNSIVTLGCEVKFVDHADARIQQARLVFPEEAQRSHCISVLSPIGSALIGLGPGQSIRWTEQGRERSLAVLEVRARKSGQRSEHEI
jgi:regulator of nucleoside diphosphate kinase